MNAGAARLKSLQNQQFRDMRPALPLSTSATLLSNVFIVLPR